MENPEHKYTNSLINESSPYLLQHAHNPVDWHAWNEETLENAKTENKMILVSIGYSACHWCHVMEHESFEDEEVAKIMNEYFICIKVDREKRVRSGLDDKVLTSWNALMLNGYVDAFYATREKEYLDVAVASGNFLLNNVKQTDGGLFHSYKQGNARIHGFLKDYAFVIEAFINLYQATGNESWIYEAKSLADYVFHHFYDQPSGMFYFTSDDSKDLITRKMEVTDNVIPASNSSLANSLLKLSLLFEDTQYRKTAERMLQNVADNLQKYPTAFSNWGILFFKFAYPFSTFVICGPDAEQKAKELFKNFLPNVLVAVASTESELPVFKNRFRENETIIYVCFGNECKLPVH
ncbi:MAG: DUF255 domain-containing protein [Bacteroidales bacterium]|nr:DUF255 domain-containing protein [Bacteroidales bacterium]